MGPSKSFVVRVVLYSIALLYLAGDLFVFNGPVNRKVQAGRRDGPEALEKARSEGEVARVFGHSIKLGQVERAARERLWLEGRTLEGLTPGQRRIVRLAALNDLIDHELLRVKVQHHGHALPVAEAELDRAFEEMEARAGGREALLAVAEAEGMDSEDELRHRLAARLQQESYLESRIAAGISSSEEEARAWWEEHSGALGLPPRAKIRHVFRSSGRHGPDEAQARLVRALADLKAGRVDFNQLARTLSEDETSKHSGGDLGWVTEARLPEDFGRVIFAMEPRRPELLQSKLGWHLVEVMEVEAAESRNFEEAKGEILAAFESAKRKEMVEGFRKQLRAMEGIAVHVRPEMITGE